VNVVSRFRRRSAETIEKDMRRTLVALILAVPVAAYGATNTIGADYGRGQSAGLNCSTSSAADFPACVKRDDAWRLYYGFMFNERFGLRITHTELDELRLTRDTDAIFDLPVISSRLDDLAATMTFPLSKVVSITAKGGLARWEERRSIFFFGSDSQSEGYSPVFGMNLDFGNRLLRAGVSVDVYPSVGGTDYVRYYGAGLRFVW